jgi:hypothetical protein
MTSDATTPSSDAQDTRASIRRCPKKPATATGTAAYEALEFVLQQRALKRDGRAAVMEARPSAVESAAFQVLSAIDDLRAQAQVPKWLFSTILVVALAAGVGVALGPLLFQSGSPCPVHPVMGHVALGKVIPAGAQLAFHPVAGELPDQAVPRATVRADGSFTVSTFRSDDGAPPGTYVVTIQWFRLSKDGAPGPNVLPSRYAAPSSSPLQVAIASGRNELPPFTICR